MQKRTRRPQAAGAGTRIAHPRARALLGCLPPCCTRLCGVCTGRAQILHESASEVPAGLFRWSEALRGLLASTLGWHYDGELVGDDDDEYAPVVVEGVDV